MAGVYELGFIGAGNMAEGIAAAVIGRQLYSGSQIIVADPIAERCQALAQQSGVTVAADNRQVVAESRRVILAVKPQSFDEAAASIADAVTGEQLLISIMAGLSTRRMAGQFGGKAVRIVRVMPNLPIKVGAGMAGVFRGEHASEQDVADVRAIFDAGGATVEVTDEELMDAVTAVSGSGPAYFYLFVEAIAAGGVACGLSEQDAFKLAMHSCLGAARMMVETGEPPAALRRKVTSKGGTTQAALEHMNTTNVSKNIRDAVRAAFQRGRKLGS